MAGSAVAALAQGNGATPAPQPLRPGDPVGVALMSGDLEIGATGTVTNVEGNRVYAFGHPFYGLGPTQFPMTRAYVHTLLPSLANSMKIASTGEVIGTVQQDRATTIAGTLGPGPALIPVRISLTSDRGTKKTFNMAMVNDQLFTPLLAYLSIVNTLSLVRAAERRGQLCRPRHGVGQEVRRRGVRGSVHAAISRRSARPPTSWRRSTCCCATRSRTWSSSGWTSRSTRASSREARRSSACGSTATASSPARRWTSRCCCGPTAARRSQGRCRVEIPPSARGSVSIMVADGTRLSQWEARELQVQPLQTRDLQQMLRVLNNARKNNRLYVRLLGRDQGAVVKGESLSSLPPSVMAVLESDRNGGSFRPLQNAVLGEWDIATEHAVNGSRTLIAANRGMKRNAAS